MLRYFSGVLALCCLLLLLLQACDKRQSSSFEEVSKGGVVAASPVNSSCLEQDIELAIKNTSFGNVCLNEKDVDRYVEKIISDEDIADFFSSPERMDQILNMLLEQKVVIFVASRKGFGNLDAEKNVYALYHREWLKSFVLPDFSALVKEDFQKNSYVEPALYSVKHVLFTGDTAYEEASDVHAKIDSGAISFDEAVQTYSKDEQTREKNGLIENIEPNQTERAFEQAFNDLKLMQVSEPTITDHGVHLIQLVGVTPERTKTFDEVKDEIKARLEKSYLDTAFKAEITQITRGAVTLNPENIQALRTKYMAIKPSTAPQVPAVPTPEAQ